MYVKPFTAVSEPKLRVWQKQALDKYDECGNPKDYLVTATPGAGKTTFALTLASRLMKAGKISRIIIVAPTDHLRTQWAENAKNFGIQLDGKLSNQMRRPSKNFCGYVSTYAQVALAPLMHRTRTEEVTSLVILDEVHHAGDGLSWGDAVYEAFEPAKYRLSLTGTPFRTSPTETIPFVSYDPQPDGSKISSADFTYGYGEALKDKVVRPVMFAAYSGVSSWRNSAGEIVSASLSEPLNKKKEMAAWRTALNPAGKWIPHVFASADSRLDELRSTVTPDAGGLVLASDQDSAREYVKVLHKLTGHKPILVLSEDKNSSKKITQFANNNDKWVVAVRQISEGVDVPRIGVIVWATAYRTPLFFAQAVGRAIRARNPQETATVFLPAVRPLLALAANMEEERNHIIPPPEKDDKHGLDFELDEIPDVVENEDTDERGKGFEALNADAEFAHLLFGGKAHVGSGDDVDSLSDEEQDYIGLPGLLDPASVSVLLKKRDSELKEKLRGVSIKDDVSDDAPLVNQHERELALRKEINGLVSKVAKKQNRSHAQIHSIVKNAVPGPPSKVAPVPVLESRRDYLYSLASR